MSPVIKSMPRGSKAAAPSRKPAAGRGGKTPPRTPPGGSKKNPKIKKKGPVPGAKKIIGQLLPSFSRQLAAMLSAGMPIVAALTALEEQQDNPHFKAVVAQVRANIENGHALSEALKPFPSIFDDLYINMVRGGETGGQLAETIARLATFLESSAKLKRKVKSAMTYPTIVFSIAILIALLMIIFIVPVFASMFEDFGATLPGPTQFLINISDGLRFAGPVLLPAIVILIVVFKKWKATPQGAFTVDKMILRAPVFGELITKVAAARFARTLAQLIHSGVPILTALEIVAGATGNCVCESVIMDARSSVERGDPLSVALEGQTVFPKLVVRMMSAGEKTGKVDEMMNSIADFYDDEVETMLAGLTSLIEPFLMVFLGVVVGGILIGMFLPIFKMGEIVSM